MNDPRHEKARLECRAGIHALECADYVGVQPEWLSLTGTFTLGELKQVVVLYEKFLNETR